MGGRILTGIRRHYTSTGRNSAMMRGQVNAGRALPMGLGLGALSYRAAARRGGGGNLAVGTSGIAGRAHFVSTARASGVTRRAGSASGAPFITFELVAEPLLAELDRLAKEATPDIMANTLRAVMMQLLGKIHLKTPVDTGLARSTWLVARRAVSQLSVPKIRNARALETGSSGAGRIQDGAAESVTVEAELNDPLSGRMFIAVENRLPYIVPLEYGWSGQAPLGMVRLSVAEMSGRTGTQIAELFRAEWLASMYAAGRELRAFSRQSRGLGRVSGVTV